MVNVVIDVDVVVISLCYMGDFIFDCCRVFLEYGLEFVVGN